MNAPATRTRPSARLAGMLVAAGLVYFFATNSEVVWLYLVAAMLLALVPLGLLGPGLALRRLRVRVGPLRREGFDPPLRQDRGAIFTDDRLEVALEVERGTLLSCWVSAVRLAGVEPHAAGGPVPADLDVDASGRRAWLTFTPPRRGRWRIESVELGTAWPLGLAGATRRHPLEVEVLVRPRYWLPPSDAAAGAVEGGEAARRRGPGEDLLGLREYRPGDARRRIHWPTSARAGALMVVETAAPQASPDAYALTLSGAASEATQDLAVAVAASLIAGSVAAGRPFRAAIASAGTATAWRDAVGRLAGAGPGTPAAGLNPGEVRIEASADGVAVRRGDAVLATVPAGATLDDARAALPGAAP